MEVLRDKTRSVRMQPHRIATSIAIVTKPSRVIFASAIHYQQCNRSTKVYPFVIKAITLPEV